MNDKLFIYLFIYLFEYLLSQTMRSITKYKYYLYL